MLEMNRKAITLFGRLFGVEKSTVWIGNEKYLTRWILYVGGGTLRLHKFWRGDDGRASHTHPWWFITFPLAPYIEDVYRQGIWKGRRVVKAFRPHFRSAKFEHIVISRAVQKVDTDMFAVATLPYWARDPRPFYTIVISGHRSNAWGFYPEPGLFIYWRDYK